MLGKTAELQEERTRRVIAESTAAALRDQVAGLERQTSHLREALERESALLERAQERLDNLVTTIVEMKREGFVPAPFADPGNLEKLGISLPDEILEAIEQRSPEGSQLRAQLTKGALSQMRQPGADAGKVAATILQGGSPPEED